MPEGAPAWDVRYSRVFRRQLSMADLRPLAATIERRIGVLLQDPYQAAGAERLRNQFAGLRSARIDRRWRIIYRICGECRQLGDQRRRSLDCCLVGGTADRTVNILMVSDHYSDIPEGFEFDD